MAPSSAFSKETGLVLWYWRPPKSCCSIDGDNGAPKTTMYACPWVVSVAVWFRRTIC